MKATFKVQHQILSGLKYVQVVKRMGVSNKMQEMIVRYLHCLSPLVLSVICRKASRIVYFTELKQSGIS